MICFVFNPCEQELKYTNCKVCRGVRPATEKGPTYDIAAENKAQILEIWGEYPLIVITPRW